MIEQHTNSNVVCPKKGSTDGDSEESSKDSEGGQTRERVDVELVVLYN